MKNYKLLKISISLSLILGLFLAFGTKTSVSAATDPANAPMDWAFEESSIPLHDAILAKYPAIDSAPNGNGDGYISISEAASWNGTTINLNAQNLSGTMKGLRFFTNSSFVTLNLYNNNFEGNLDEIMYLTNLKSINLQTNNISGSIPSTINNLSNLQTLIIADNNISGDIPDQLYTMTSLNVLSAHTNQLTGTLSPNIGNLINLTRISFGNNKLTGTIPKEIGSLIKLTSIGLDMNNFEGILPIEIYDLPLLKTLDISLNPDLEGNPALGFTSNNTLENLYINGTNMIQAKPDAPNLSDERFIYDNLAEDLFAEDGTLSNEVTQKEIDKAQDSANYWNEPTKSEWQEMIDRAQELLNQREAEKAVDNLLDIDGIIKEEVIQKDIEDAQDLINKVTDQTKKEELQNKLDEVQKQLNEKEAQKKVNDLFSEDGKINETVTNDNIKDAQKAVDKLLDSDLKNKLQDKINEAQKQLDEKLFLVVNEFARFTGKGTVSATINAPIEKFSKVYVDGKLLLENNYVVTSGSTVITLNENYLLTLSNGTYDVEVEFTSGAKVSIPLKVEVAATIVTDPTDPISKPSTAPSGEYPITSVTSTKTVGSVNTGDTTDLTTMYIMAAISLLGMILIVKRRKQENQ